MKIVESIYDLPKAYREKLTKYDLVLANCHVANYGKIYLDEFYAPMEIEDVVYMLEGEVI